MACRRHARNARAHAYAWARALTLCERTAPPVSCCTAIASCTEDDEDEDEEAEKEPASSAAPAADVTPEMDAETKLKLMAPERDIQLKASLQDLVAALSTS